MFENLKNLTVIYVEDNKFTRNLIKKALNHLVKKVYLAEDGHEGLELYKKVLPDIVLTDRYMPNMDGFEMSKKIREINPMQPIGMFTAEVEKGTEEEHVNIYMLKPFNRKEFFTALDYLAKLTC